MDHKEAIQAIQVVKEHIRNVNGGPVDMGQFGEITRESLGKWLLKIVVARDLASAEKLIKLGVTPSREDIRMHSCIISGVDGAMSLLAPWA